MESPIFRNRRVFEDNYIPNTLRVRREEAEMLARRLLTKLLEGPAYSDITLIYGSIGVVGIGKTMIAKYAGLKAVSEARRRGVNAVYVHVNAYGATSLYYILDSLVAQLRMKVPVRGSSTIEVMRVIADKLAREDMYLILTIDEFQSLLTGKMEEAGLYQLLRLYEQIPPPDGVSRIIYILVAMDSRILERLREHLPQIESQIGYRLHMRAYTEEELYEILLQRAEEGLRPGVWDDSHLWMIAREVASETQGGSARKAIVTLRSAAEAAEARGQSVITEDLVRWAISENVHTMLVSTRELRAMNIHDLLILLALAKINYGKGGYTTTGELTQTYRQLAENYNIKPLGHSQFHVRLSRLTQNELVEARKSGKGMRGRTTLLRISPRIPLDRMIEALEHVIIDKVSG